MSNLKEVILGILAAASSIAVFWLWSDALPLIVEGRFEEYRSFIAPVAGLVGAATLFSLLAIFVKNKWVAYSAVIIGFGAPYLFTPATNVVVGALIASIILAAVALHRIRKESELSLGFSVSKFLKVGLPLYFTIASLLVSTYFLAELNKEKAMALLLPKPALEAILKALSGPLQSTLGLPHLNLEATIDETLTELIKTELQSRGVQLNQLSRKELTRLISAQREEFGKNLGIKIDGREKILDVFYGAIINRINDFLGPYRRYLPWASTAAFFLAFKALAFPLYYLALLITWLLIKFLIVIKILKSEKLDIEVERLTL